MVSSKFFFICELFSKVKQSLGLMYLNSISARVSDSLAFSMDSFLTVIEPSYKICLRTASQLRLVSRALPFHCLV